MARLTNTFIDAMEYAVKKPHAKKLDRCSQDNLVGPLPVKPKVKKTLYKMTKQEQNLVICAAHIQHYVIKAIQTRVFTENKPRTIQQLAVIDEQISHTLTLLGDYHKALSKP